MEGVARGHEMRKYRWVSLNLTSWVCDRWTNVVILTFGFLWFNRARQAKESSAKCKTHKPNPLTDMRLPNCTPTAIQYIQYIYSTVPKSLSHFQRNALIWGSLQNNDLNSFYSNDNIQSAVNRKTWFFLSLHVIPNASSELVGFSLSICNVVCNCVTFFL